MVTALGSRSSVLNVVPVQAIRPWFQSATWAVAARRKGRRLSKLDRSLVERGVGRWQFHALCFRHRLVSHSTQLWSPGFKRDEVKLEEERRHLALGALWGWYGVSRGLSQKRKQRLHLPDWMQIGLCPSCLHSKQGGLLQDRSNSETVPLPQCSTEPELAPCPELGIWWLGLSQLALQLSSFGDGSSREICPGLLRRRQERRCAPAGSPGAMSCLWEQPAADAWKSSVRTGAAAAMLPSVLSQLAIISSYRLPESGVRGFFCM